MPTSNGLITSRDIRQQAVKTLHIVDEAVTTPKIPDLAITFPDKIDNPLWVDIFQQRVFSNVTFTTTATSFQTIQVDIPAWVNQVTIFGIGHVQITNTSGGDVLVSAGVRIEDQDLGGGSNEAPHDSTKTMAISGVASLTNVAGSTVDVDLFVHLSTGTNTSNNGYLRGFVVGTR